MFYGSSASMSLPSKKKLKRQSRTFTQVLYRTLSYRDRRSVTDISDQVADDPAELSTQTSVPGVLKIFGDEICMGANYKSVLATPRSSAQELVKEALERYSLNKAAVCKYLLCDVIGRFEGADKRWRTECLRALGDNEKPLLLQDLWKPKEGFVRRFELRRRAEVEEMAAREKDTVTAGTVDAHWFCVQACSLHEDVFVHKQLLPCSYAVQDSEGYCPLRGWFHWSRGVQIQGSLRLVLEWAGKVGLSHLAEEFFSKFSSAVSLLATPTLQLVQMTWKSLCSDYPALKPAQLHHLLTKYQLAPDAGPVLAWQPSPEEKAQIYRTVDLAESFENHPPIVLPSSGFQVDFESDTVDDNIYRQLLYVRHFLWSLRAKSPSTNGSTDSQELQREPPLSHCSPRPVAPIGHSTPTNHYHTGSHLETQLDGRVSVVSNLSSGPRDGQCHEDRLNHMGRNSSFLQSMQPLDPSCLLTSPNTPLYTDFSQQNSSPLNMGGRTIHDINKELNGFTVSGVEGNSNGVIDFPTPVSSSLSSAADDFCYVFIVELDKGPFGLGMGLIDGLHTPLNTPGIYIRTLIPDGPAASDGRLNIGDRILAVNGTSLIGADYQSAYSNRITRKKVLLIVTWRKAGVSLQYFTDGPHGQGQGGVSVPVPAWASPLRGWGQHKQGHALQLQQVDELAGPCVDLFNILLAVPRGHSSAAGEGTHLREKQRNPLQRKTNNEMN
ncbi:Ras-associating and dilute domain-containing protein [Acipenser ruthenus]|uniref:Ras-associating and dilute domain-containing protein n=1 Tax=Acipenser ruthenus TaxID=7906 RepID=A0A444UBJ4_ACIRT|nr:Ras-associating and dilute domain-containing protein [Acipenser ruthenus]